ncbi:MAG TPA: hypothetical protein VK633_02075 [Verrucomicrobiae bacterium]|nr:hypothetical protein [Verrucomicrobiae bacterium]
MKLKLWIPRASSLALLVATILFAACIPSLQPLYSEKDLVFDPSLIGSFLEEKDKVVVWTFTKAGERDYHLVIKEKEKRSPLSAHLFKIAGDQYIDLYPENEGFEDWQREDFFKSAIVPAHIFFRVTQIDPVLKVHALQEDWLKEYLAANKNAVPHSIVDNNRIVFTGSTDQMQSFLKKIASEKGAWSDPAEFRKQKASPRK